MNLNAPTKTIFWVSVALAVIGIILYAVNRQNLPFSPTIKIFN